MKWLKSTFALAALVGATAISGSALAYHSRWHHHHYGPRTDVSVGFTVVDPWYAPAPRYYYEPVPRYYYRPAPVHYYGYAPGYYYYAYPSAIPYDSSKD